MRLLNPLMLAFLGLIPILIILHKLRPRPKRMNITNFFLWQAVFNERTSNITIKNLKKNIPLFLQILMIILGSIALASPVWTYIGQKRGDIILIVDTSASMKTRTGTGIRFDQAVQKATEIIEQRRSDQKLMMIEAGREPRIVTGFSDNTQKVKELLNDLTPSDEPGDLQNGLYLALSFVKPASDDSVYLITDGAGIEFQKLPEIYPKLTPVLIHGGDNNIGITKFAFRKEPGSLNHYVIMIEVKNFNSKPVYCPVKLTVDRTVLYNSVLSLDTFEKKSLFIPYNGLITGILRASLDIEDDLPVDNIAYLPLSASQDIWVLLVSKGNFFLEKLLDAYPNIRVNSMNVIDPSTWEAQVSHHDIVIIDRMDFPSTKRGNLIVFDGYSPTIPFEREGQIDYPSGISWEKEDTLMESIDLDGVLIEKASKLKPGIGVKPIVSSQQTGLIYTYENDGLRAVFFGFDITRSDLPIRVAFPVLISNIINWLTPNKLESSTMQTRAGEPIDIYVSPDTTTISTLIPGGKWQQHTITDNPFRYTDTKKVGIYAISEKDKRRFFAVNLVNELESDINVPEINTVARGDKSSEQVAVYRSLWGLAVILILVALFFEWRFWLKVG